MGNFLPFIGFGTGVTPTAFTTSRDSSGYGFFCALLSHGQTKCWGGSRIIRSLPHPRCQDVAVACLN